MKFWSEKFVSLDLSKNLYLKRLSVQAFGNKETIEKYEFEIFFKQFYYSILEDGVSLNYEHDEDEGATDNEMSDIFELVFVFKFS